MPAAFLAVLIAFLSTYGTTNITFPNGQVIKVELAMTAEEVARGLTGRKAIPESGILIVYKAPTVTKYHLMAYPGPMDLVYLDDTKTVINLIPNVTPCPIGPGECGQSSIWPHIYGLQLPAGTIKRLNLHAGDKLSFTVPKTPPF